MSMRVLITGGAGFIGSTIADRLLARGDDVLVIDNYATGRRENNAPSPRLTVVEGTIADAGLVQRAMADFKPSVVVHAAASYKDPNAWLEDAQTNVVGSVNVIQAAEQVGVKRFIYFQTALCYGTAPQEQPISMRHPILPGASSYAISKTAAEHYLSLSKLDWMSFRLANAYGPRNLSGPLPTFFSRLTTGKACFCVDARRDFIFVDDLVDCVMKGIDGRGTSGPYHISSGSDVSIEDLYGATVRALALSPAPVAEKRPRGPDDAPSILLDPSATNAAFDWRASTPLDAGVARAIEWYRVHGVTQTYTHLKLDPPKER
jgi:UDP-glucose 4-epimerase